MTDNALMRPPPPAATWTNIPPSMTGRQIQGTSLLPLGLYEMPDGSRQASFGLPQPLLEAYRSMRIGSGMEQDPNAPQGFMSVDQIARGGQGLGGAAMTGSAVASGVAGPVGQVVGSGMLGNLRNMIIKSMRDSRINRAQRKVDAAKGLDEVPELPSSPGAQVSRDIQGKAFRDHPSDQLYWHAGQRKTIQQIAQDTGTTPEHVARVIRSTPKRDPNQPDPNVAKSTRTEMGRLRGEARGVERDLRKGRQGQRVLDEDVRRNPQQVSQDLPDQIAGPSNTVNGPPPAPPTPPKQAPKPKQTPEERTKDLDIFEGHFSDGGDLPTRRAKVTGPNYSVEDMYQELTGKGMSMTKGQFNTLLKKVEKSGTSGKEAGDFINKSRKAGTIRSSGVPMDPSHPDSEFTHVDRDGTVHVGGDEDDD